MTEMKSKLPVIVIGAGLSGTLLAIRMAQRGHEVVLFEKRPDMRKVDISAGRSINLALSNRGLKALRLIGLEREMLDLTIPMYGRMIHDTEGNTSLQSYSGRSNHFIRSISRGELNIRLLNKAESLDNVSIYFNSPCTHVDLRAGVVHYRDAQGREQEMTGQVIFGADGAGSALRNSMSRHSATLRFSFSQKFLQHGYKELTFPALEGGQHCIDKNALHIWPKGGYMLIALPNLDGSFTVTLFLPFEGENSFDQLQTGAQVRRFFEEQFPDAVPHMPRLEEEFFEHPTGALATVKCYPWQVGGKTLLMGDAAHAVVPFYGQGMNASFEDVTILDQLMGDAFDGNWEQLFKRYQELRKPDADAIGDMAEENYYEMRDKVKDDTFVIKRQLELSLEQAFEDYHSKYALVTFKDDVPYHVAMQKGHCQDEYLMHFCKNLIEEYIDKIDLSVLHRQLKKYCR